MFGNKKDQARSIIRSHVLWSIDIYQALEKLGQLKVFIF